MKKYLFMISSMQIGGAEVGLVDVMNELSKTNKVDLVLLRKEGELLKKINKKIKIYGILDKNRSPLLNKIIRIMYFMGGIFTKIVYKITIKEKYDVECAYLEGYPAVFISNSPNKNSTKIASIRVGLKKHQLKIERNKYGRMLLKKAYKKMDRIYTVSELTTKEFVEKYPQFSSKTSTIYTYFDIKSINEKANEKCKEIYNKKYFNILAVGRMDEQKSYDRLIKSFNEVHKKYPNTHLHIIGKNDTEYGNKIKTMIKTMKLEDCIILEGIIENPYPYIKNADVLVSSSLYEGFPRVVNEALALKQLCIGTDVTGTKEALKHGKLGILVEDNINGLTNGMIKVIENKKIKENYITELSKYDGNKKHFFEKFEELTHKKKSLLIILPKLSIGGMEKAAINLINIGKLNEKYDLTLFLVYRGENNYCYLLPKDIKLKVMCPSKWNYFGKIIAAIKLLLYGVYFKFKKYDIAVSYSHQHKILAKLARTASHNNICFIHSNIEMSRNEKQLKKLLSNLKYENFKKLICVSDNGQQTLKRLINRNDIHSVNNLFDGDNILEKSKESIDDYQFDKNIPTFINVGRHDESVKKLSRIIEAMKKLNEQGYKYNVLFIGDGESHEQYKSLKKEYNLYNLSIIGARKNPYKYYKYSSACVLSSKSEGYPVVFLECMMLNIPILTTDVSDARKDIEGKYGIVVENNDNSIYEAMKRFLDHPFDIQKKFDYKKYNEDIITKLTNIFEE